MSARLPSILTPAAITRLAVGWGTFAATLALAPVLVAPVPTPLLIGALAGIVAVILVCAFGVVGEAEHLAHRLGDPYGSLVLTLSIAGIEVILISAVMLGPGEHTTIARDSVMAVSMIILNLVIGLALVLGGRRHGPLAHRRTGTWTYLAMIVMLGALAFALPAVIGRAGSYTSAQSIPITVLTVAAYAFFLYRQLGPRAGDFRELEPSHALPGEASTPHLGIIQVLRAHRAEVLGRIALLVVTALPIVLLSHQMASLLDDGLARLGAPVALPGILIAMIVFLPETITTVRAALAGQIQRVSNLCHGALVSTLGLTIPAVLVIGLTTGQQVVLAESVANLLLLGVSVALSIATFSAKKVRAAGGVAHLAVFAAYGVMVFV